MSPYLNYLLPVVFPKIRYSLQYQFCTTQFYMPLRRKSVEHQSIVQEPLAYSLPQCWHFELTTGRTLDHFIAIQTVKTFFLFMYVDM